MEAEFRIEPAVAEHVLSTLGLRSWPGNDESGLRKLYEAWCHNVPFDNVRKLTALYAAEPGRLPGSTAADFLAHWLRHGTGGTCWPSSNGLYAVLRMCGFPARRIAASMQDAGTANHGSIIVTIRSRDWLVDSSMLTNQPLSLTPKRVQIEHKAFLRYEIDPLDDGPVIWFEAVPRPQLRPCRILQDPVDEDFYKDRYEHSRTESPFNHRLYARRNYPGEVRVLIGHTCYHKSAAGLDVRELNADELQEALTADIGIAPEMVSRWARSGALAASMQEAPPRQFPPLSIVPPSERLAS